MCTLTIDLCTGNLMLAQMSSLRDSTALCLRHSILPIWHHRIRHRGVPTGMAALQTSCLFGCSHCACVTFTRFLSSQKRVGSVHTVQGDVNPATLSLFINLSQATVRRLPVLRKTATVIARLSCRNCTLEHSQMASQWGVISPSRVFSHLSVQLKKELKNIIGICNIPCKVSDP